MPNYPFPVEIRDGAIDAYEAGYNAREVAEMFGISSGAVYKWLYAAGKKARGTYTYPKAKYPKLGPLRRVVGGYIARTIGKDYWLYESMGATSGTHSRKIMEHRRIMAEHLGRPLTKEETVHHMNGIRDDNRIENLELHGGQHGNQQRWVCVNCGGTDRKAVPLNG